MLKLKTAKIKKSRQPFTNSYRDVFKEYDRLLSTHLGYNMVDKEVHQLIDGCINHDRKCQKLLYKAFYGFAMGICLRYAGNRDEAAEVMNQGFLKVFTHIEKYDANKPFKAWLGRIMMNASIDHYRTNLKMAYTDDLEKAEHVSDSNLPDRKLYYDELLAMIQTLPQAYRTVFNLFAIEGYGHDKIGEMLGISAGTSKSNLFKARAKLKEMILRADETYVERGSGKGTYQSVVAISATSITGIYNNRGFRL